MADTHPLGVRHRPRHPRLLRAAIVAALASSTSVLGDEDGDRASGVRVAASICNPRVTLCEHPPGYRPETDAAARSDELAGGSRRVLRDLSVLACNPRVKVCQDMTPPLGRTNDAVSAARDRPRRLFGGLCNPRVKVCED